MLQPRYYQDEAKNAIIAEWDKGNQRTLLVLPTGTGKCLGRGTPVLMFDGHIKKVEDVKPGDKLMGPDSHARTVVSVCCGNEMLYRVVPTKGDQYIVNESHILSLRRTNDHGMPKYPCQRRGGEIVNLEVRDFLNRSKTWKRIHKGWRAAVDFQQVGHIVMDPWLLGLWLGDGNSRTPTITSGDQEIAQALGVIAESNGLSLRVKFNSEGSNNYHLCSEKGKSGCKGGANPILNQLNHYGLLLNKHIPHEYKTASRAVRLELLAGIIDSDGSLNENGYDLTLSNERFLDDVVFVARSLGFSAYKKPCVKTCCNNGVESSVWRTYISGEVDAIPCRVSRKKAQPRKQKKNVLNIGIKVIPIGVGEYFGFEIEGPDRLFLLGDFTVTHNTIVFARVIEDMVRLGKRVLILAHRGELLDQAADKLATATGLACSVEKAESTSIGEWFRVVVGSVQTMMREKRLEKFAHDWFDVIVVDEAHHVLADSYQRVLDWFPDALVLGVTATPDRGDMKELGQYFQSLAYEYSLPRAIKDGFLSPIKALTIPLEIELGGVSVQAGDFRAADLGNALDPYLHKIADEMAHHCQGRKVVVFLPLIATSQKFCAILKEKGFRAAEVNGESRARAEILQEFDLGYYDVLCNSMLLTEGWDCPSVDTIVCLRPTKIRSLYAQIVGRGTRIHPGKDHLLLLDFLWHSERHELCRPAHLIATCKDVADKMTEMIADAATPVDIEQIELAAEGSCVKDREERLAEKLREMRKRKRTLVDPLQFEMSIQAEDLANYVPAFGWEAAPPSKTQVAALEKAGIYPDEIDNAGKASLLLDRLAKRRQEGLATPKQIRFLESKGFQHVGTWGFESARKMIDRIAGNNWTVPRDISASNYVPKHKQEPVGELAF